MPQHPLPIPAGVMFLTSLIGCVMLFFTYRDRGTPGMRPFRLMIAAVTVWSACAGVEELTTSLQLKILWSTLALFGAAPLPVLFYLFVRRYTHGAPRARNRWPAALFLLPVFTLVIAATNRWHGQYWPAFSIDTASGRAVYGHGPAFWAFVFASYALIVAALAALLRAGARYQGVYRRQVATLVVMAGVPFAANVAYTAGWIPLPGFEPTPIAFLLSLGLLWFGMLRYRILDLLPVARDVLIDTLEDAVFVVDAGGRIADANPAAAALLGRATETLLGQAVSLACREHPELVHALSAESLNTGIPVLLNLHINGEPRSFEVWSTGLRRDLAGSAGHLSVVRDVTQRLRDEHTLRVTATELALRNRELDTFAHTVAHDLKIPVASMIGMADTLRLEWDALTDRERKSGLAVISTSAWSMHRIINDMLLLASIRSQEEVPIETVALGTAVTRACARLQEEVSRRGAVIHLPDEWPEVLGQAVWIELLLVNLVSNALKYGGDAGHGIPPCIHLGWSGDGSASDFDRIRCFVRDNGPGIPQEYRAELFQEFSRFTQRSVDGHGLGLSIARRIVLRMNGTIGYMDGPGGGSEFWFTLPAAPPIAQQEAA